MPPSPPKILPKSKDRLVLIQHPYLVHPTHCIAICLYLKWHVKQLFYITTIHITIARPIETVFMVLTARNSSNIVSMSMSFFSLSFLISPVSASTNQPPRSLPSMYRHLQSSLLDWPDAWIFYQFRLLTNAILMPIPNLTRNMVIRTIRPFNNFTYVEYIWSSKSCIIEQILAHFDHLVSTLVHKTNHKIKNYNRNKFVLWIIYIQMCWQKPISPPD